MGDQPMRAVDFEVRTRGTAESSSRPTAAAAVAVAVVTGGLAALELFRSVHTRDAGTRAAVETVIAAATLASVRLLYGTLDRRRELRGLLLIFGIVVLAIGDVAYWIGSVVAGPSTATSASAVRLTCQLIGAFALVGAACVRSSVVVRSPGQSARVATALGVAAILGTIVLAEVLAGSSTANWTAGSVGVGVDLLSTAALVVAAMAFVARPSRIEHGADLLAGACLLLAAGGVQSVTMPVVHTDWVTPREGASVLAFALVLGASCLRYRHVQRHRAYAAICSERERAARDLHDGLAQDLACITTAAQRLDCDLAPEHPLMLVTRDALAEVRGMIADLTASTASTSEEAVRMVARDVGRRLDLDVDVRADPERAPRADGGLELGSRDALIRATREAITNAAVQGQACQVDVALGRRAGNVVVRVSGGADRASETPGGEVPRARRAPGVSRLPAQWSRRSRRPRLI